ncbi:hypothetical protein EAH76_10955 [Sphingomonas glacialis]|uniref:Uncharacterized protein n=1 Tax=Sphingomonas glacialis TaxID=658225 RepID=A0A502G0L5_9SPHN|nr:hypothetical protein EAH76_10955 [Sphingomonas glacialis]
MRHGIHQAFAQCLQSILRALLAADLPGGEKMLDRNLSRHRGKRCFETADQWSVEPLVIEESVSALLRFKTNDPDATLGLTTRRKL